MTTLAKILMTISIASSAILTWFVITKIEIKQFIQEIQAATADGKIDAEEAVRLISRVFAIFK